jgi:hypothetical protein
MSNGSLKEALLWEGWVGGMVRWACRSDCLRDAREPHRGLSSTLGEHVRHNTT